MRWCAAAICLAAMAAGCAKSGDVERIDSENRVRDARIKALEDGMVEAARAQSAQLLQRVEALQRAVEARAAATSERLDQLASEQARIEGEGEQTRADFKKHERRFEKYVKSEAVAWQEQANEVDKLRLRIQDVERLLKSPIADLPSATAADKAWREAYYLMISGQLDIAADRFAQFMQSYPADKRLPEALLRQGQAYYLMRKYDFSLAPLYELAQKYGTAKAAVEGRWFIARALEETGDLKLARDFYAQLVNGKTAYAADAQRRLALIQKLYAGAAVAPHGPAQAPAEPDLGEPPDTRPGRPAPTSGPQSPEPAPAGARAPGTPAPDLPAGGQKG